MAKKKRAKRETVRGLSVDPATFDLTWLTALEPDEDADGERDEEHEPKAE